MYVYMDIFSAQNVFGYSNEKQGEEMSWQVAKLKTQSQLNTVVRICYRYLIFSFSFPGAVYGTYEAIRYKVCI